MGRINPTKTIAGLVAGFMAFGVAGVAVASGGLTANLALSGTFFSVKLENITGTGFSLFMDTDQKGDDPIPVARIRFDHADASNLCLSTTLPDLPAIGEATFAVRAEGTNAVNADGLLAGVTDVEGQLKLTEANVGIDASQVNPKAPGGAWGVSSDEISVRADSLNATSVGAKSLTVTGVKMSVRRGSGNGC